MAGLDSSVNYVRKELGSRMQLRRTPTVKFLQDRSLERGDEMLNLLNKISQERQNKSEIVE